MSHMSPLVVGTLSKITLAPAKLLVCGHVPFQKGHCHSVLFFVGLYHLVLQWKKLLEWLLLRNKPSYPQKTTCCSQTKASINSFPSSLPLKLVCFLWVNRDHHITNSNSTRVIHGNPSKLPYICFNLDPHNKKWVPSFLFACAAQQDNQQGKH